MAMGGRIPVVADRREALRGMLGLGLAGAAMPLMSDLLISPAHAQASPGVQRGQGDLVHIKGDAVEALPMAEWEAAASGAEAAGSPLRYLSGAEVAKAPPQASHYTVKTYDFPAGTLRVLTFKKGVPLLHQISFETEIFVLQGSATLTPLFGLPGKAQKVGAGDALFLPSGMLRNPKCAEDTILVTAVVGNTAKAPKASIVRAKDATESHNVEWQEAGKDVRATTPAEIKKAPPGAARFSTKRYVFDGNSMRLATLKKGGRTSTATTGRSDVLIYIVKGRMGRTEGSQSFEVVAGDAVREKLGNPGHWELLEDSVFLATDSPLNPANYSPTMVAR